MPPVAGRKHRTSHLQTVPAMVPAITQLAAELKELGVQMVSMEATSDYWRVWFAVLEEAGAGGAAGELLPGQEPAGPAEDRQGRRAVDRAADRDGDAAVLVRAAAADPGAAGLYPAHLGPDRGPHQVLAAAGKAAGGRPCKLTSVVSKLAGHQTARAIIEAMIAGERDPQVLAALGRGKMRNDKLPALAEALSGMRFGPQHAHAAASLLRAIDLLEAELQDLQEQVAAHLAAIPASWGVDGDGVTGPQAGTGPAGLPRCLQRTGWMEIPGLGGEAAIALIAEIGLEISRFPTPQALVSWAGLTPTARQSGPRKGRGKKGRGNTYAKRIAVLAAYAAANTDTFLGERFRRLASRPGGGGRKKAGRRPPPAPSSSSSAPAERPRRPLPRPRPRLARQAHRPQPQGPQRPAPARGPRLRRHHHPPGGRCLIREPADNRIAVTASPGQPLSRVTPRHARNCGHASGLRWLFLGQTAQPQVDLCSVTCGNARGLDPRPRCVPRMSHMVRMGHRMICGFADVELIRTRSAIIFSDRIPKASPYRLHAIAFVSRRDGLPGVT